MKTSKYNSLFLHPEHKFLLVFNSLTKRYIKVQKGAYDVFCMLSNRESKIEKSQLTVKLLEAGVLVDDDTDEEGLARLYHYDYINSSYLDLCILPTEKCNLRCPYCYEDFKNGAMSESVQRSLILWVQKNIHLFSGVRIRWFGGEPLLEKNIIYSISDSLLKICRTLRKPFTATVTTNGTLLDTETTLMLLKRHVYSIQITLDGPESVHDKIKGLGTYKRVLENLKDIRDNVTCKYLSIVVRTNLTQETLPLLPEYIKDMSNEFGGDSRFLFFFRPVGEWKSEKKFGVEKDLIITDLDMIYDVLLSTGIPLNYSIYSDFLENQVCFVAKRNQCVIRSTGAINKCTMLLNEEVNQVGQLSCDGTISMNKSKLSRWVVPKISDDEQCTQCEVFPSCLRKSCIAKHVALPSKHFCGYESRSIGSIMQLLDMSGKFETIDFEG